MVQLGDRMASEDELPEYLAPYARAVAAYGTGFGSLLMTDHAWQAARFAVFARALDLRERAIADLGSGRADLLAWLERQHIGCRRYVAVEAVPEFHDFARSRSAPKQVAAHFVHADFVREVELCERLVAEHELDTLLFSGSLNTLSEADALTVLDRAWRSLAEVRSAALGFNFLAGGDAWPRPTTRLPRRETSRWFAWACERTPLVMFFQHYLGAHDATIVMLRPD
jgi:hypothetical protein